MYRGFFNNLSQDLSQNKEDKIGFKGDIPPYVLPVLKPVDKNLNKRWYIDFEVWDANLNNGEGDLHRFQKRVPKEYKTVKEKEAWAAPHLAELTNALRLGKHIRRKEVPKLKPDKFKQENLTIINAFKRIYEIVQFQVKPDSAKDYRLSVLHFKNWLVDNNYDRIMITEMTSELIISFLDDYQADNGVGNVTRNNRLRNLSSLTTQLVKRGFLERNVMFDVGTLKEAKSQNHPFTEKHLDILLPELKLFKNKQLWQACQFIYFLFIRPTELEFLKVHQINLKTGNVMVPNTFKSGQVKHPDICDDLFKMMIEMGIKDAHPDWYVFGTEGVPGPKKRKHSYFTKKFADVRDNLELPKQYKFYCWKHTGNLHFLLDGGSLTAAQKQNGHGSLATTEIYSRSIGYNFNLEIRSKQSGARLKS